MFKRSFLSLCLFSLAVVFAQAAQANPITLNDGELVATDKDKYVAMLGLAEGSLGEAEFADWLRSRISVRSRGQVQEAGAGYGR